jgi:3-oxoacyl-[acyl-carrier protein] reductase
MKQKSGSVINITSIAGVYGNLGQANYSASKAGVVGMTKALSKEVAPFGVRVNAVAPGFIDTDMTTGVDEKQLMQKTKSIPLRRIGTADEVANVVTFLASEKASYITGAEIQVDGGLTL